MPLRALSMRVVDSAEELASGAPCLHRRPAPRARALSHSALPQHKRMALARAASAADDGGSAAGAADTASVPAAEPALQRLQRPEEWDALTDRLCGLSTLPFLFLFLPQLLMNARNLAAGNTAALAVLSWLSYLTGLGGNTLLLSYFAGKRERNAVVVQALGIASSFAVITQLRLAGLVPHALYAALAVVVGLQAILTGLKLAGRLDGSKAGQRLWAGWQQLLGLAGLAGVPQVLWATFQPHAPSLLPSQLTLAAGCALSAAEAVGALPRALRGVWAAASAWTATALFMLQPVSQLVSNFQDPASLQGLSLATILLAAAGNGLMVPRAIWTRDVIWTAGSLWGASCFGWAQMLSMFLGRSPATGQRFLSGPLFAAFTALLWGWLAATLVMTARARRKQATA